MVIWSKAAAAGPLFCSRAVGLPLSPAKLTIPVGFALLTLQGLSELIKRIAALRGRMQLDVAYSKPDQ